MSCGRLGWYNSRMAVNDSPLEFIEQVAVVEWLEANDLKFSAIPNNTYTTSYNQKLKNRREGLRPGFSDLVVLIPPARSLDGLGYFLNIEMKRRKGGIQSADQKQWELAINGLGTPHVQYYLCKGSDEAKAVVSHYCKMSNLVF